jgi:integrase
MTLQKVLLPEQVTAQQTTDFLLFNYEQIIDQFDCSASTRKKYKTDVKLFISFVTSEGLHLNVFRQFKKHLDTMATISTKTKRGKLTAAKRVLTELKERYQLLKLDLTAGTKNFQISAEHVKDGLSAFEVANVKAVILNEQDDFRRFRLLSMFSLLALQGLRQFEVTGLKVEDLKLDDKTAFIKGKGRDDKERIDLHPDTVQALKTYLLLSGKKSGYLFTSISKASKSDSEALTERGVRKVFAGLFQKAGLPEGKSVHGFRHFFVTRILEVTAGDLLTVQKFSRHKSLTAIKYYDDRKRKQDLLPTYYAAF